MIECGENAPMPHHSWVLTSLGITYMYVLSYSSCLKIFDWVLSATLLRHSFRFLLLQRLTFAVVKEVDIRLLLLHPLVAPFL